MPEADAEGDTPWLWPTTGEYRRHEAPFAFGFAFVSNGSDTGNVSRSSEPRRHSILHSPRENKKEWKVAGRWFEGARTRAPERITTESNRTIRYKATTRAERATSVGILGKMSSSSVVDTHQTRDKVGFGLVFFGRRQRKPMICGHAARFARVEGEVRKIQSRRFLEGGFF